MVDLVELADREGVSIDDFVNSVLTCTASIAHAAIAEHKDPNKDNVTEFIVQNANYSFRITVERVPLPHNIWNGVFDRRRKKRA